MRSLVVVALVAGALSCNDLSRFSTAPNEAYCGSIALGAAFRSGLSPRVQMRLTLDASRLDGPDPAGAITTFEATAPPVKMLDDAQLRRVPALENDPLSHLELGDGRARNAIFAVSPADPDAEAMLAVLSLKTDDTIEVRLVRPGATPATGTVPPGRTPIFGLFTLGRQTGTCGF